MRRTFVCGWSLTVVVVMAGWAPRDAFAQGAPAAPGAEPRPARAAASVEANLPGAPALAQEPLRLTLEQALALGMEASHRLAEVKEREAASQAVVQGREAAKRGQVAVQAGYTRTNHVEAFGIRMPSGVYQIIYPDIPDNYRSRIDVQWPLFTFGRLEAGVRGAMAESEATAKDVLTARADLRLDITRAYWSYLTASETVGVLQAALKNIEAHLADVRNRLNVGLVPPSDVLSAQSQRSRQQVLLIEAINGREVAAADLARLIGAQPGTPIELNARLEDVPALAQAAETLVAEARATRPERQALERRVAAAGEHRQAAAAATRPTITVAGGVDYSRPNPRIFPRTAEFQPSWDASVNLNWPLWDGGRARADVAEASAGERAISERLKDFDVTLDVEVRQRRLDLESALASIAAATDAVKSAAEARRIVGERYAAGVATNTEVLDAQVALLTAELERTRALASSHLAAARLERALGR